MSIFRSGDPFNFNVLAHQPGLPIQRAAIRRRAANETFSTWQQGRHGDLLLAIACAE